MPPEDTTGAPTPTPQPTPEQPKKPGFFAKLFGFAKRTEENTPRQNATGVTDQNDPSQTPQPVASEPTLPEAPASVQPMQAPAEPVSAPAPDLISPQQTPQSAEPVVNPSPVTPSTDLTPPPTDQSTGAPQVETPSSPDADGATTAPEVQVPPSVQTPTPGDNGTLPVQPPQNPPQNQ